VAEFTKEALKKAISKILDVDSQDIDKLIALKRKQGEPLKIMFVGINGTGKTTTIAKVATYYIDKGYKPVIAASDTFRAGAIEQLTHHADKIGVKIIKHKKGADPAAVAFDAVEHAKAQSKDLVLVDTAGRMQTNINLMDEMKKIKRVINPDLILFVGDALTGNDAVEQARKFDDAVGVDGIVLTKADADAKGGAALSIGHVISKPILFLGTGQSYSDIMVFKPDWMVEQVFGESK
ncbi:MAG: signal recognition particle-docking protein FtsY, partial [Methanobacterium sp.]|nr:signal recognition particle-docking protein FtsY [Methanobacterium sp.]